MLNIAMMFVLVLVSPLSFSQSKMPPMDRVYDTIYFEDDLDFEYMEIAINRQLKYFNKANLSQTMRFGSTTIKRSHLKKSLLKFQELVVTTKSCLVLNLREKCFKDFNNNLNKFFKAYKPLPAKWEKGYKEGKTLFTAYYSPDLHGSKTKTKVFKNPIYGLPKDKKLARATSDQINFQGVLKGRGLELFYVSESLYDIWLLHVEGGGRVQVQNADGTKSYYYLSYKASNKQSFNMLYKYMLEEGMLKKGEATIANQRKYFLENPEHQRDILKTCPSFIFFSITESEPLGVKNIPLTIKRSLATDYRRMEEYGIINFIKYKKPKFSDDGVKMVPFSRFFINQDTGGAIKGNARSDLYFGFGDDAELSANYIYGLGEQYFLILK